MHTKTATQPLKKTFPYLLDIQSNLLEELKTTVLMPLPPSPNFVQSSKLRASRTFRSLNNWQASTEIKRKKDYSGNLNNIGGFYLELFACVHHGAKITVLLGPEINPSHLKKILSVLADLLFPKAHSIINPL